AVDQLINVYLMQRFREQARSHTSPFQPMDVCRPERCFSGKKKAVHRPSAPPKMPLSTATTIR
ncbi:hypothetical protein NUV89_28150, partial [Pseudomonas sp. 18.1.10]|uniref:hypothetical protein n=1 Tax=Pseudomonas sp. 18.1.10 TaxID=2969302 RepID=UPI00214FC67E